MQLRDIVEIIRRHILLVLVFVVAGGAAAFYKVKTQEPTYLATAVIRIVDPQAELATGILGDVGQSANLPTLLQLLRSSAVMGEIVDNEGLRLVSRTRGISVGELAAVSIPAEVSNDSLVLDFARDQFRVQGPTGEVSSSYGDTVNAGGIVLSVPRRPQVDQAIFTVEARQRAIQSLAGSLVTRVRAGTNVVDVQYSAPNRDLAQRVVNSAVRTFQLQNQNEARTAAVRKRIFLQEQLAVWEADLAVAQQALSDFRTRERVFSSAELFQSQQRNLQSVDVQILGLRTDRNMFRSLLDEVESLDVGDGLGQIEILIASPEIAQNATVTSLFRDLLTLASQRTNLVTGPGRVAAGNPELLQVDEQIREYRARLYNAVRTYIDFLDARIAGLETYKEEVSTQIAELPETEVEQTRLAQQVDLINRNVVDIRQQLQLAQMAEAVEEGPVRIVDLAPRPLGAQAGSSRLILAVGLLLGLMLGGGAAFVAESLNTKIRRRDEMEALLQIPSVGIVPRLPGGAAAFLRSGPINRVKGLLGGGSNGKKRRGVHEEELVTISDARSPHAEAYRTIRTNLLYSDSVSQIKTVVVTSPTPGEGKSTTASNLAVAYAQQGMKALLIDCDLRKARLHNLFGLPRNPGLTELVMGKVTWEEAVHDGPTEGLQVLTSGTHPPNPSELVGGARMRKALELFRDHYDVIIVDTPPLIAGPDAAILGSYCDGVVLVVRAGQTEKEAGQQAVRQLHTVGARILGAILNDPDGELPRYSSYYAYQYKYYYGSDEKD